MTSPLSFAPPDRLLAKLAAATVGQVHGPDDPRYAELAAGRNLALSTHPLAVLEAVSSADVVAAMQFAGRHRLQVAVKATGHGSTSADRDTLLVHTGRLDELVIRADGTARVGAGVRWCDVLSASAPLGLAGLAGSAPDVGVVGYLTGGGHGPLARTFGLSSDRVTAFDVVTGDGQQRRVTASDNRGLFWALRGGKGALGIVTTVEFTLLPLTEILGGCVYFDGADARSVLQSWRAWTQTLPDAATSSVAILRLPDRAEVPQPLRCRTTVALRYAWVGLPEAGHAAIAPMLAIAPIIFGSIDTLPYEKIGSIHSDPVHPMPMAMMNTLLRELPAEAVDVLLEAAGPDRPDCPQLLVELRHLGGALRHRPANPDAFDHRDAAYSLFTVGIVAPGDNETVVQHAHQLKASMRPWTTGGRLPNFVTSTDPGDVAQMYTAETLSRLAALSATYDPDDSIAAAHTIRTLETDEPSSTVRASQQRGEPQWLS